MQKNIKNIINSSFIFEGNMKNEKKNNRNIEEDIKIISLYFRFRAFSLLYYLNDKNLVLNKNSRKNQNIIENNQIKIDSLKNYDNLQIDENIIIKLKNFVLKENFQINREKSISIIKKQQGNGNFHILIKYLNFFQRNKKI